MRKAFGFLRRGRALLSLAGIALLTSSAPLLGACERSSTGCCRVCTTGKACGDTCIDRSSTCNRGAGCACDG